MIWRELWLCLLAVVLRKERTRRWVLKTQYARPYARSRHHPSVCACEECEHEFDPYLRWARIR